jgi:hypothetical protein
VFCLPSLYLDSDSSLPFLCCQPKQIDANCRIM